MTEGQFQELWSKYLAGSLMAEEVGVVFAEVRRLQLLADELAEAWARRPSSIAHSNTCRHMRTGGLCDCGTGVVSALLAKHAEMKQGGGAKDGATEGHAADNIDIRPPMR